VFTKITDKALSDISALREQVDAGEVCPGLGSKADSICNEALEGFSTAAPDTGDDPEQESIFDEKVEELEKLLDLPLQALYQRQLNLLVQRALQRFKAAAKGSETSDYQAMIQADQYFSREAEASTRQGGAWDYAQERTGLQSTMNEIITSTKKATDAQLRAAQQQNAAMQYLQMQQQQIQGLQQQLYGGSSPWNFGAAYRVPDSNIQLQGNYQQGRATVQMSCVPDEYAPLLGPNGFVNGVGPGNLGLSVNLNI
ncbi:unnamed protein product, partial [Chrysoparadoxa australica]